MVRPQSAAAFAVALTSACHDVGLRPPETVTEHGGHVRFWWHAKPRRAWAQLDAEGEVLFCFDAPPALSSFEAVQAGDGADPEGQPLVPLRACLDRVKAYLEPKAPPP